MARKPTALVLDSWSVIAYFEDEPAGEQVADLIAGSHDDEISLLMSVINLGEVWYILAREMSEEQADQCIADLNHLRIEFVDADWKLTLAAGQIKAKHKMSYGDCFAAALAKENAATLVTGDREFKQVDGEIDVHWL